MHHKLKIFRECFQPLKNKNVSLLVSVNSSPRLPANIVWHSSRLTHKNETFYKRKLNRQSCSKQLFLTKRKANNDSFLWKCCSLAGLAEGTPLPLHEIWHEITRDRSRYVLKKVIGCKSGPVVTSVPSLKITSASKGNFGSGCRIVFTHSF